jgi:lipid A ethanolaminephosphotransferase
MLLNVVYTNSTEVFPLFSWEMAPYILFLLILPTYFISKTDIIYDCPLKHILKTVAIVILSLLLALGSIYASFKEVHRAGNLSNKYILYQLVPVNILAATIDVVKKKVVRPLLGKEKSYDELVDAKVTSKDDLIVVLAIGEALRQKNLNLYGYTRNITTPNLSQIKELHILNGIAKQGSTINALKEILRKDGDKLANITRSAEVNTTAYSNFTMYDNVVVKEVKAKANKYKKAYDEDVVPLLKDDLQSYKGGYKFIMLHLGAGAHGPIYSLRYPKPYQKYKPMCEDPDMINNCTEEERYNAYDNALLYQDYAVNEVIKTLDNSNHPYVLIFTSDHGESLGENGYVYHGMPPGMALPDEQAHIPLLVKSSVPIEIIKKEKYFQPDIFDTVLDLLSIEFDGHEKEGSFIKRK